MEESTDCQELKNLKYKTILLNGVPLQEIKPSSSNDLSNLDKFLENEKNKVLIDKLKKEASDKYKKEIEEYKKKVKENKNKTIKDVIIKPKRDKVKLNKIKNPPKKYKNGPIIFPPKKKGLKK